MKGPRLMPLLPIEAYRSQAWFDREQEAIFSRLWRYAGFAEDLCEPGQYLSVQAGLNNIFVVMGRDRRLRAFHNLCRHRGTRLLRTRGKTQRTITCPYHCWTYDLEGKLIGVPEEQREFRGLDRSRLSLKPASVELWRGMIFVHPDPEAGPIVEWFGDIEPHLGPHKVEALVEDPGTRATYDIKANWKIVVENYIDHYHLAHLHAGTLSMYDHKRADFGFRGPHFAFWEPLAPHYLQDIERKAPLPLILPKDKLGAWAPMLFPGLGLSETETSWSTFHLEPLAPDLTRVEVRTRVKEASAWAFKMQEWRSWPFWSKQETGRRAAGEGDREPDPLTSGDFMAEDIYVCEQQQKSLQSPYFEVGPTAERGESPVRQHQQIVLDFLEERR